MFPTLPASTSEPDPTVFSVIVLLLPLMVLLSVSERAELLIHCWLEPIVIGEPIVSGPAP